MARQINDIASILTPVSVAEDFADEAEHTWLLEQANDYGLVYLLAHMDDGLIWGRVADGTLHLSTGIAPNSPKLRPITLQSCRLFGPSAELFIWRNGSERRARLIEDKTGNTGVAFDEAQILWGTDLVKSENGFTLVRDGRMGHHHAVPKEIKASYFDGEWRPARLEVRHYLTTDDHTGLSRIARSRLVNVTAKERGS